MKPDILHEEIGLKVKEIDRADIIVGIPSYNNEKTIENVVRTVGKGLSTYYPNLKAVIVDSDGGSKDKTCEIFLKTPVPDGIEKIVTQYKGVPGKGSAFRTIFEIGERLGIKMCLVLDADSRSITPEWIKALANPIYLHNYGVVTPYYLRDKHDATITNSLVYPLTQALYGLRIRQPIGGDFGLTGGLITVLNHQRLWEYDTDVARFGIDIWLTTTAITEGFRVCQASLGAKVHDAKDPGSDLSPMFKQVVGTLFSLMKKYKVRWKLVKASKEVRIMGKFHFVELEEVKVALPELIAKFKQGKTQYRKVWKNILSNKNYRDVIKLAYLGVEDFNFPADLWAKIVYDYAVGYCFDGDKDEILMSLIPLYYGRTAAFVIESRAVSEELADAVVEGVAGIFERMKPYLLRKWSKAERQADKERLG
ncbi:glycosyltransferase [Candidatus Oleimmundimicrobium sp.]|uniref:glycosyltransferase family 2 protein n=1 Tax=Candidatus Oleimmundimicrobium sp. TaxID=3060597 RepID=UPI0027237BD4|nr:glycosyltransferase [Candidatus Oleimmundimicrobium sp.]MDO8885900.1 glycosyltransferase [Candidatus Oleimmundimicrobium sp.]